MTGDSGRKAQKEYEKRTGYRAQKDYQHDNVTKVTVGINRRYDAELLARLEEQPSKSGYVKGLIKNDIERSRRAEAIGRRLSSILIDKGMTADDLAAAVDVSAATVGEWCSGRDMELSEGVKVARALGVTVDYLAGADA